MYYGLEVYTMCVVLTSLHLLIINKANRGTEFCKKKKINYTSSQILFSFLICRVILKRRDVPSCETMWPHHVTSFWIMNIQFSDFIPFLFVSSCSMSMLIRFLSSLLWVLCLTRLLFLSFSFCTFCCFFFLPPLVYDC